MGIRRSRNRRRASGLVWQLLLCQLAIAKDKAFHPEDTMPNRVSRLAMQSCLDAGLSVCPTPLELTDSFNILLAPERIDRLRKRQQREHVPNFVDPTASAVPCSWLAYRDKKRYGSTRVYPRTSSKKTKLHDWERKFDHT